MVWVRVTIYLLRINFSTGVNMYNGIVTSYWYRLSCSHRITENVFEGIVVVVAAGLDC